MNDRRTLSLAAALCTLFFCLQHPISYAVQCDADDPGAEHVLLGDPRGIRTALTENRCAEYILGASEHAIGNPIFLRDVDVLISGGWASGSLDNDNPEQLDVPTVIDIVIGRGFTIEADPTGPRRTIVLDNLIIEGSGRRDTPERGRGGGILADGPIDLYLRNVVIRDNFAITGGAVHLTNGARLLSYDDSNPPAFSADTETFLAAGDTRRATRSQVSGNIATHGGGIYCDGGSMINLRQVMIESNTAEHSGGGVFASNCDVSGSGVFINGNEAEEFTGGGLFLRHSTMDLRGGTVFSNDAGQQAGGIYLGDSSGYWQGNINANSAARGDGGGVYCEAPDGTRSILMLGQSNIKTNRAARAGGGVFLSDCTLTHDTARSNYAIEVAQNAVNDDFSDPLAVTDNANLHAGGGLFARRSNVTLGDIDLNIAVRLFSNRVSQQRDSDGSFRDVVENPVPPRFRELGASGGAIEVQSGRVRLQNFEMRDNRAPIGAALALTVNGEAELLAGEVTQNHATGRDVSAYSNNSCISGQGALYAGTFKFHQLHERHRLTLDRVHLARNQGYVCSNVFVLNASSLSVRHGDASVINSAFFEDAGDSARYAINVGSGGRLEMRHSTVAVQPFIAAVGDALFGYTGGAEFSLHNSLFYILGRPLFGSSLSQRFNALDFHCSAFPAPLEESSVLGSSIDRSVEDYIELDPDFEPFENLVQGDLRLEEGSLAVDRCALAPELQLQHLVDLSGQPRPVDSGLGEPLRVYDAGAYENPVGTIVLSNASVDLEQPAPTTLSTEGTELPVIVDNVGRTNQIDSLTMSGADTFTDLEFLGVASGTTSLWTCTNQNQHDLLCNLNLPLFSGNRHVLKFLARPSAESEEAEISITLTTRQPEVTQDDNHLDAVFDVTNDSLPPPDPEIFRDSFE